MISKSLADIKSIVDEVVKLLSQSVENAVIHYLYKCHKCYILWQTLGLQSDMERVQRRAMNIIYPNTPYIEALANAQLTSLKQRRAQLCEHFFTQIKELQHKLHKLLQKPRTTTHNAQCHTRYSLPRVKTNRPKNCFINWCLFNQKNSQ